MATMTVAKALNAGLRRALEADPKVLLAGEDIGKLGGVFRITEHLQRDFGADRVIDSPLAESGILGTAVGLALRGYRPVVEIQFDGFVYPAFDQIISQVSRMHFRSHGQLKMPIVVRIPYGGGIGAIEHHSESPEAYFAHTPGLKVVTCSNPLDAYWMIQQATASNNPIVFFEPKRRYHEKGEVDTETEPMPLYQARVVKPGDDLTLITYGPMVRTCVEAAIAAGEDSHDVEVIDLRSLAPLDMATVIESVHKTGRAIVVHEAALTLGMGAEIAARLQQECFFALQAPVLRVTGYDIPYPPSRVEAAFLPDLDRVLDAIDRSMAY
ncbi:MAG TPA: alpha-ketoacid dehydrogenase subunit beta [Micropruina sp.]|nr:alpha-ketoacid dehydrogenase subunit beta [Micropruina sp.]